ncbi:hypothetical protein BGZ89_012413, partial [Linnemannia elongata]
VTDKNIVTAALRHPAPPTANKFEIDLDGNHIKRLAPQAASDPNAAAFVYNALDVAETVGLGDSSGRSYLTMHVPAKDAVRFLFDAEFAIVPIGETVQDKSKLVTGTLYKPWFSFKLHDVTKEDISFNFDGNKVTDLDGLHGITSHKADEPVFG